MTTFRGTKTTDDTRALGGILRGRPYRPSPPGNLLATGSESLQHARWSNASIYEVQVFGRVISPGEAYGRRLLPA
jgi:hypothetical protein